MPAVARSPNDTGEAAATPIVGVTAAVTISRLLRSPPSLPLLQIAPRKKMAGAADAAKEYVAGCAAGIAQVVVGHPFDTVKVKLQAHNTTAHGNVYKNAFHCCSRILLHEGIRGLYKGASSSFIGITVESSLFFGTYSQAKQLLQGKSEDGRPQLHVIIPSATCSGALISCILTPTELTKNASSREGYTAC